jgi:polyphosphate glucokinase
MGKEILGIDIGGSGIKGAIVDVENGSLISNRVRIPTPAIADPENVVEVIQYIIEQLDYKGPIGIGIPGPVENGKVIRAVNLSPRWSHFRAYESFKTQLSGNPLYIVNDADAAAVAEFGFGAWPDVKHTILFLTIGTGIGSCIIRDEQFVYNTELGHIRFRKKVSFEQYASDRTRKVEELSWKRWAGRLNTVLNLYRFYFSEPYFILGGGIVKKQEKFKQYLDSNIQWHAAKLQNEAGIIGAALMAAKNAK